MTDALTRKWMALSLRLLSQILIKVHAGPKWGLDETGTARLSSAADSLAWDLESPEQPKESTP